MCGWWSHWCPADFQTAPEQRKNETIEYNTIKKINTAGVEINTKQSTLPDPFLMFNFVSVFCSTRYSCERE